MENPDPQEPHRNVPPFLNEFYDRYNKKSKFLDELNLYFLAAGDTSAVETVHSIQEDLQDIGKTLDSLKDFIHNKGSRNIEQKAEIAGEELKSPETASDDDSKHSTLLESETGGHVDTDAENVTPICDDFVNLNLKEN